jgi:hypothetical protein
LIAWTWTWACAAAPSALSPAFSGTSVATVLYGLWLLYMLAFRG